MNEEVLIKDYVSTLEFYVNGKKVVDTGADPEWTLLYYLRYKLGLCGTKLGCAEGGCGACTVMVSRLNRITGQVQHMAVNACLAPVCAMHGLAVTTVEGIGSTRTQLHPVQERIAKAHGSQCGFCTPGIVMSMYALLRSLPKPTMHDVEVAMQGNLCRCTGYRAIIEGFRTFTQEEGDNNFSCAMGDNCCKKQNGFPNGLSNGNGVSSSENGHSLDDKVESDEIKVGIVRKPLSDEVLFSPNEFQPYHPSQEAIFASELRLSDRLDQQALRISGRRVTWYRPLRLKGLLKIKDRFPTAKIVTGNTEIGVEVKFKSCLYPVLISTSGVSELQLVGLGQDDGWAYLRVGAAVTLTALREALQDQITSQPEYRTRIFSAIIEMLHLFAGNQIRNVAGVGGNIMTGSPISDLNPIFMAAGCKLELQSYNGDCRIVPLDGNFFTGYRKNIVRPNEVLVALHVPFTQSNEYFCALKQSRRREDDIAIVNLALRVDVDPDSLEIHDAAVALGGMAPTTALSSACRGALLNKRWDNEALEAAQAALENDFPLPPGTPGGMERYRRTLALSLFLKAFLKISEKITTIPDNLRSAVTPSTSNSYSSAQYYQTVPGTQNKTDLVGRPVMHQSAFKQATGEAVYCDDVPPAPDELYLSLVLSTRTYARLISVDPSAALEISGVRGFISAKDILKERNTLGSIIKDEEVFATSKVVHQGQAIAAIIADDPLTARRAAGQVRVEYQDLAPAIITIEEAIEAGSFLSPPNVMRCGDPEAAMEAAPYSVSGEFRIGGQEHFYLETLSARAVPKEDGELEVTCCAQGPSYVQQNVAHVLGIPSNRVTCRVKRLGGGFGGKESKIMIVAIPVAIAAYKYGKPVRAMLDRDEDMVATAGRHPFLAKYRVGFDDIGTLQAVKIELYSNIGCSMDLSPAVMERAMHHCFNAYSIPHMHIEGRSCKTNLPSMTAFRGFGCPQALLLAETMIRHVSWFIKRNHVEVVERNLMQDGHRMVYNMTLQGVTVGRCWNEVLKQSNYHNRIHAIEEFNKTSRYRKRGLAAMPCIHGVGFSLSFMNQAGAFVNVYLDGSVLISHGGTEMGQGLHTKVIQIASRTLSIDSRYIHITETATDKVPNTFATAASVSSDLYGMATLLACTKILERLKPYKSANPDGGWENWVKSAHFDCVSLSATGFYTVPGIDYNFEKNTGTPYTYFTYGAACSEVEVDCLTGDHEVLSTDIVMDLGESLNPAIDVGQIEGAFMQGYGLYMMEEPVVSPEGVLLSRGPGAYKIPGFGDIPKKFTVTLLKGSGNPRAVYSSKAVGEPPLALSGAIFMAVREAVTAARRDQGLESWFRMDAPATAATIRLNCEDNITAKIPEPIRGTYRPWNISP